MPTSCASAPWGPGSQGPKLSHRVLCTTKLNRHRQGPEARVPWGGGASKRVAKPLHILTALSRQPPASQRPTSLLKALGMVSQRVTLVARLGLPWKVPGRPAKLSPEVSPIGAPFGLSIPFPTSDKYFLFLSTSISIQW